MSPVFEQPRWVAADRPRRIRDWTPSTTVFVTDWGDRVHLYPDCPGTIGYGSDGKTRKAALSDRICAARSGCLRCFGEFFSSDSLRELERLIARLHGTVDPDQPARRVIAAKAKLRFGDDGDSPPAAPSRESNGRAVRSSGFKTPPDRPRSSSGGTIPLSKAGAKRQRDAAEARKLGISVEELRSRRRADHEARTAKNRERRGSD